MGGAKRDRTVDLLHAMQALSQLSYSPISRTGRMLRAPRLAVNNIFPASPKFLPLEQLLRANRQSDAALTRGCAARTETQQRTLQSHQAMAASSFSHSLISFFEVPPSSSSA